MSGFDDATLPPVFLPTAPLLDSQGNEVLQCAWDPAAQVLTIHGMRYSAALFQDLGGLLRVGQLFMVAERADGVLTIQQLDSTQRAAEAIARHQLLKDETLAQLLEHYHGREACEAAGYGLELHIDAMRRALQAVLK